MESVGGFHIVLYYDLCLWTGNEDMCMYVCMCVKFRIGHPTVMVISHRDRITSFRDFRDIYNTKVPIATLDFCFPSPSSKNPPTPCRFQSNKKSSKFHRITIRNRKRHAAPLADEAFLELGDKAHAPGRVVEELEAALDVLDLDGLGLALLGEEGGGGNEVAGVAQAGLGADLGEQGQGVGREVDFLLLRADGEDLADLVALVGVRADDDDAVEEVEGEAVRGAVGGASDPRVAPVAGHDHDGG